MSIEKQMFYAKYWRIGGRYISLVTPEMNRNVIELGAKDKSHVILGREGSHCFPATLCPNLAEIESRQLIVVNDRNGIIT